MNFLYMICYRTSPAAFIVPFDKYMDSVKNNCAIGMKFKMRFEGEDAPEQRYDLLLNPAYHFSNFMKKGGKMKREFG